MKGLLSALLVVGTSLQGALAEPRGGPYTEDEWPSTARAAPESANSRNAGESSKMAGDVRPGVAVPQLSVPIKGTDGAKAQNQMRSRPSSGGVDDGVARCLSRKTAQEREECERALRE